MINRFLRRLTVRRRVLGGFLGLALLLALTIPVIVTDHTLLVNRLQQATREADTQQTLLRASVRVEASRVNLSRYLQDYLPSSQVALDDTTEAIENLTEIKPFLTLPDQQAQLESILTALDEYRTLVRNVETARRKGDQPETTRALFLVYQAGANIEQQIDLIVSDNERLIAETDNAAQSGAQTRLAVLSSSFAIALALALVAGIAIAQSITRPVNELRNGAEAFSQGHLDATLPVAGADELSTLARTFNEMATQLSRSYRELEQRVADRTAELKRRSSYLEASAEVSRAATLILETDQLMRQAVELIRERFDLYYVGLFEVEEAGTLAILKAGTGEAGRAMLARGHQLRMGGDSMIGWCIANAKARVAEEASADAIRRATPELPDTQSEAALPLRSRGKVIGALTVQSTLPNAFDEAAIAVLQTMADQVAVALDNARLFAASQAALETTRRAYGELSRQGWEQLIRSQPLGYLRTLHETHLAEGPWQPEMVQATQTGQIVQDHGSTVAAPIKVRDQVLGVIRLRKPTGAETWTLEETALLKTLTEQLGVALDSARLYQDSQRRAAREQLTRQITDNIRAASSVEDAMQRAVGELARVLDTAELVARIGTEQDLLAERSTSGNGGSDAPGGKA
jgi:nitrate/nitrite-specific signal transduction histidine kinase